VDGERSYTFSFTLSWRGVRGEIEVNEEGEVVIGGYMVGKIGA